MDTAIYYGVRSESIPGTREPGNVAHARRTKPNYRPNAESRVLKDCGSQICRVRVAARLRRQGTGPARDPTIVLLRGLGAVDDGSARRACGFG
jgi:hypothetical protein